MLPKFDLLVAGEINPDLILTGDIVPEFGQMEKLIKSATLTVGSSSAIFACGAARLGLKVNFVGVCGEDVFGRFMLDEMKKKGLGVSDVIINPSMQTGISVILARGSDRAILTHPGTIAILSADQVTDMLLQNARHLHVASYFLQTNLQPGLLGLFDRAHAFGLTTSLDTNWDPSEKWTGFGDLLRRVDVFLPNENEAKAISGETTIQAAAEKLSEFTGTVAIKMGDRGAVAHHAEESTHVPALSVDVVDTVGAGDSFDAGFLYGFLKKWNLEKTLQLAVSCGTLSTRTSGGTNSQPTLQEALQCF